MADLEDDFVHLARFALAGQRDDAAALLRRSLRELSRRRPELGKQAKELLEMAKGTRGQDLLRNGFPDPLPVDQDSRMELMRRELVSEITPEPVWSASVARELGSIVEERERAKELEDAGLQPTRSVLFVGPPGVGKTLAARWLSRKLSRPLITLDLAAVMSSYLGRTGNNIRVVLDYARRSPNVLLLDEFDAIAKRRDDATEVGELKRLVTVLLQSVDDWPADGVLLAATNHPELLDPAVWRRFDRVVHFEEPTAAEANEILARTLGDEAAAPDRSALSAALVGASHSTIVKAANDARREAILQGTPLGSVLLSRAAHLAKLGELSQRVAIARALKNHGRSQRQISEITGLSRDTIRKHSAQIT